MKKIKKIMPALILFLIFATPYLCMASGIALPTGVGLPDPSDTTGQGPVVQVIANILRWILTVFLLLAVISFVITGLQYILAFGDTYKAEKAKNNFMYSIIAVAVVGAAMIIIYTINFLLL